MKSIIITLLLVLSTSNISYADNTETKATAEELLSIINMKQALEQSIEQMLNVQTQQNPALAPYKTVMRVFLKKHMSFESLKEDMVKIYAEAFSKKELKEIIVFYKTPTGRKTVAKMPELMAKGAQLGAARVQANISELQNMLKEESARIQELQDK